MTTVLARGAVLKITRRHTEMVRKEGRAHPNNRTCQRANRTYSRWPRAHQATPSLPRRTAACPQSARASAAASFPDGEIDHVAPLDDGGIGRNSVALAPRRLIVALRYLLVGAANATAPPGCVASSAMAAHCNRTCRCAGWRVGTDDTATSWCPLSLPPTKNRNRNRQ